MEKIGLILALWENEFSTAGKNYILMRSRNIIETIQQRKHYGILGLWEIQKFEIICLKHSRNKLTEEDQGNLMR